MRSVLIAVFILLVAPISGLVTAENENLQDSSEDEQSLIIPTYSIAVQLAFERVSNLEQYTKEDLENTKQWLVVSANNIDEQMKMKPEAVSIERASQLQGAYIWNFDSALEIVEEFEKLVRNGDIESFSPLIKKQQVTRSIPSDEVFEDQWHLQNTGQTSGTFGEDANVTSVWNSYTGSGIIISVVDDGLDKDHPDISPNYSPNHSYDWCNNDADPTPTSNNGHGLSLIHI